MNLAWIAAVLRPQVVAPHPNFPDYVPEAPAELAQVVLGQWWRADLSRFPNATPNEAPTDPAIAMVRRSLQPETIEEGVAELLSEVAAPSDPDPARVCALALVACCAAAELDDYDACDTALDQAIGRLHGAGPVDGQLITAVLLQQRSLRLRDSGRPYEQSAIDSLRALAEVQVEKCSIFDISPAVTESHADALTHITAALRNAALSLLPRSHDREWSQLLPSWQDAVRSPTPDQLKYIESNRADSYAAFVDGLFDARLSRTGPRNSTSDLFYSLLALELLGHGRVYRAREELAQLRLLGESTALADVLRLFRHATSKRDLDLALRWFRSNGPLDELAVDARRILRMRRSPERLRVVELKVLRNAAELLAPRDAELALQAILDCLDAGGPWNLPGQWEADVLRKEQAWTAISALANVTERTDVVANRLLSEAEQLDLDDQLADRAMAAAVRRLDWSAIQQPTRERWSSWLDSRSGQARSTTQALAAGLGVLEPLVPDQRRLEALAEKLNQVITGRVSALEIGLPELELVRASLAEIRTSAEKGHFSIGALSAADIAVGLIVHAGSELLWDDVTAFLSDPAIIRVEKTPALERLARELTDPLPDHVFASFVGSASGLLEAPGDAFLSSDVLIPYPAALRFLAAKDVIDEEESFVIISQLANQSSPAARREAAHTVALLSSTKGSPWLMALAMQFSYDSDPDARGFSGQALVRLGRRDPTWSRVAEQRILSLLDADGLSAPGAVIQGLSEMPHEISDTVASSLDRLSAQHVSSAIRRQAHRVLRARVSG